MLRIDDLCVSYGGIEAVKGISLRVEEGQIVTLIGANGAGKSTTLRAISGLVKVKSGRVHFQGEDLTGLPPDQIVSKGLTLVPEGRHVFPDLTVLENLKIGAYLRKDNLESDLAWIYELFPRLKERSWQAAGTLSGGEQQMLAVGRALMARPKLIMMDEPSLGLAPIVVKDHQGDQPQGRHRPAHRAERQHGPADCRRGLCDGDRPHHPERLRQGAAGQRGRPQGLPGQPRKIKSALSRADKQHPICWTVCDTA